ncbi:hypothetical protein PghCCS26_11510 [Paenibacillus glycanilyticus]|uniref:Uncharacterized protein n=1 Tax=Paenibacillus glycanilyticus TaxID=126569 RepID=A0ABQ6NJ11_9BACL|nr:hypothetical protein PghCCS26_11510 [Paenibacillus glycanilyticus]
MGSFAALRARSLSFRLHLRKLGGINKSAVVIIHLPKLLRGEMMLLPDPVGDQRMIIATAD